MTNRENIIRLLRFPLFRNARARNIHNPTYGVLTKSEALPPNSRIFYVFRQSPFGFIIISNYLLYVWAIVWCEKYITGAI